MSEKTNFIKEPQPPCKDCTKRHFKCHSECDGYKQFKKDREEFLKVKEKFMRPIHEAMAYECISCERARRRRNNHKRG